MPRAPAPFRGFWAILPLQAELEIQGPGVTPFDADNQNLVMNAFSYVMTTVTRADFLIRYYTSDSSQVPSFSGRRRLLLASQARPHSLAAALTCHCSNALCLWVLQVANSPQPHLVPCIRPADNQGSTPLTYRSGRNQSAPAEGL